jgi:penicillin-binding protein 2
MRSGRARPLKNLHAEAALFRRRALVGFLIIATSMLVLAGWYFRLQVIHNADYRDQAERNRTRQRPIVPARGLIYDRAGRLLADNGQAWRLELVPDEVPDLNDTLRQLGRIIAISSDDLDRFDKLRHATPGFRAVPLKLGLSEAEVARFAIDRQRFPGVDVTPYLTRRYPYGALFAHVIGYVGRVDADDLAKLGDSRYAVLSQIGKGGLEHYYEPQLRGEIGFEQVETNVEGRAGRVLGRQPAKPGRDLQLSIDAGLQQVTVEAFGDHDGAAIAVDPRSGEILAMVSLPSYDPNLFVNGISHTDYAALTDNLSKPLYNRIVQGGTPPGSTIKPFLALAGLESGLRTPSDRILSTGEFHIPGQARGYRDAEAGGVGWVDLTGAIAQSVNTYFYQLAMDMGIARLDEYMTRYGFGQRTGVDLSGESVGVLPSPEWKRKRFKQPWYLGETVIAGIGQGYWVVTPLQLAQGVESLADDGVRRQLHLARATRGGFGAAWQPLPQPPGVTIASNQANLAAVRAGMLAVVNSPHGTARAIGVNAPYLIAGKTGTAQTVGRKGNISRDPHSLPLNLRHQALFIAYAPANDPRIAVAVLVEHGGYGATAAAPIARAMIDAWLLPGTPTAQASLQAAETGKPLSGAVPQDVPDDAVPATDPDVPPTGDLPR